MSRATRNTGRRSRPSARWHNSINGTREERRAEDSRQRAQNPWPRLPRITLPPPPPPPREPETPQGLAGTYAATAGHAASVSGNSSERYGMRGFLVRCWSWEEFLGLCAGPETERRYAFSSSMSQFTTVTVGTVSMMAARDVLLARGFSTVVQVTGTNGTALIFDRRSPGFMHHDEVALIVETSVVERALSVAGPFVVAEPVVSDPRNSNADDESQYVLSDLLGNFSPPADDARAWRGMALALRREWMRERQSRQRCQDGEARLNRLIRLDGCVCVNCGCMLVHHDDNGRCFRLGVATRWRSSLTGARDCPACASRGATLSLMSVDSWCCEDHTPRVDAAPSVAVSPSGMRGIKLLEE